MIIVLSVKRDRRIGRQGVYKRQKIGIRSDSRPPPIALLGRTGEILILRFVDQSELSFRQNFSFFTSLLLIIGGFVVALSNIIS